jgi:serine/threonine protein kinase
MADLSGQRLGGYALTAMLGRSGIAELYRGQRPGLVQDVAVAVFHGCPVDDEAYLERFRGEADLATALRHGNIVRVLAYDVAIANGEALPYLVTELAGGLILRGRIAQLAAAGQLMPPRAKPNATSPRSTTAWRLVVATRKPRWR